MIQCVSQRHWIGKWNKIIFYYLSLYIELSLTKNYHNSTLDIKLIIIAKYNSISLITTQITNKIKKLYDIIHYKLWSYKPKYH